MAMSTTEIAQLLSASIADASIEVQGGEGKYQVQVVADIFAGLNRVKRQQIIYRVLNDHIASGAIHAVNMNLKTSGEAIEEATSDKQA
jgi:acid stress-induced BolA-like protein IbaG/YrbA